MPVGVDVPVLITVIVAMGVSGLTVYVVVHPVDGNRSGARRTARNEPSSEPVNSARHAECLLGGPATFPADPVVRPRTI